MFRNGKHLLMSYVHPLCAKILKVLTGKFATSVKPKAHVNPTTKVNVLKQDHRHNSTRVCVDDKVSFTYSRRMIPINNTEIKITITLY